MDPGTFADSAASNSVWLQDAQNRSNSQRRNIAAIQDAVEMESEVLARLDSSLKKLTAFMKKTKSISSSQPASQLIPELDKLNVLKFLDEIAANLCELKLKAADVNDVVAFIVRVRCLYPQFSELLLFELKKNIPFKKSDKVDNPAKLKVDLKLLGELILNGVLEKPGIDLLGAALSYLVASDSGEFTVVPLLLPFCRPLLFDFIGAIPFSEKEKISLSPSQIGELVSPVLSDSNKKALRNLFTNLNDALVNHLNNVRIKMNKIRKVIKRQERTKGDASQTDRMEYDSTKQNFDRLMVAARDLAECLGLDVPPMPEEPSDDEDEAATKQLTAGNAEGALSLWNDKDGYLFYEKIPDLTRLSLLKVTVVGTVAAEDVDAEADAGDEATIEATNVIENVDAVDFSEIEAESSQSQPMIPEEPEEEELVPEDTMEEVSERSLDLNYHLQFVGTHMPDFLDNLSRALNRDLIDKAASHFVESLNRKANRKRLIQHFLNSPRDRLDLVPFYARFLALVKPVVPEVTVSVSNSLLLSFRHMASALIEPIKKGVKMPPLRVRKVDEAVFLSRFLAELTKFKLLPKAEALSCLRSLLVDLRSYKVEMLSAMIESAGTFLYRSADSHTKMKVVLSVIQKKLSVFKDPRHKVLLENAYFSVIPPDESNIVVHSRNPLHSYISLLIRSFGTKGRNPIKILAGIDWNDPEIVNFLISQLSDACAIKFDQIADVADGVRSLTDDFPDLGIFVTDNVLEAIRVALETNKIAYHQRLFCSANYLNWLYICGVCDFKIVIHALYQLISLGIPAETTSLEHIIRRTIRIRVASQLVTDVWEYTDPGYPRILLYNFVHYLLHFHYATHAMWLEREEELSKFPFDIEDRIQKMTKMLSNKKRNVGKFAKDLKSAQEIIAGIEKKYRSEIRRQVAQTAKEKQSELASIQEEEGTDEESGDENADEEIEEEEAGSSCADDDEGQTQYVDAMDPEQVRVHVERRYDENDDEFNREYERMMKEQLHIAPTQPRQTTLDLTVPPSARQKFERKVQFDSSVGVVEPVPVRGVQMALMTRGKGQKPVLKSVQLKVSQSMRDSWDMERKQNEQERSLVKEITLQMNDRMQQRAEDEKLEDLTRPVVDTSECQIPAGPRKGPP